LYTFFLLPICGPDTALSGRDLTRPPERPGLRDTLQQLAKEEIRQPVPSL